MRTWALRRGVSGAAVALLCGAVVVAQEGGEAVWAPIAWPVAADDPGARRAERAATALEAARDGLLKVLDERAKADTAREPGLDVILELSEPFMHYSGYQLRPHQGVSPQWRGELAVCLDRYYTRKQEFLPIREDARLTFHRRGGAWIGPSVGMLSGKMRQQFHLRACDAGAFTADPDGGVNGDLRLTHVSGDFRFDMHMSGEHTDNYVSEYNIGDFHIGFGDGFHPDWWHGPLVRTQPWEQRLRLKAAERRGWILRATLGLPTFTPRIRRGDRDVFLWVDEGRILRGYIGRRDRPFQNAEYVLSIEKWELRDRVLTVDLAVREGAGYSRYALRGELARPDGGALTGAYALTSGDKKSDGAMGGMLYRAFAGSYETDSIEGKASRQILAGVAPVAADAARLPAVEPRGATAAERTFRRGLDVYRQVRAVDRALREYPLPLELALIEEEEGVDNRADYWALRFRGKNVVRQPTVAVPEHLHTALAAEIAPDATGAAAYIEELARLAGQALTDHRAGARTTVGVGNNPDPDFGPHGAPRPAEKPTGGGNALPTAAADGRPDWRVLGDWTCFGVLPRSYSFDYGPYLPEVAVVSAPRALAGVASPGEAVRLAFTNEMEHMWVWRAEPGGKDGRVTMSRTPMLPTRENRSRWGTNYSNKNALFKSGPLTAHTGTTGDTMDFYYQLLATWYAGATLHADKAQRVWMAAAIGWDGRLWVNGSLVWRPDRIDTPNKIAVFPVDLVAGENRITVCCSAHPIQDGNMGNMGARIHKYAERAYGSFSVWIARGGAPRTAAEVAAADGKERAADTARAAAQKPVRGHRGDGSGWFKEARPPVAWDIEKGVNVRWKAALPTRDAEPVIVGKNLFLPTTAGELACLDADTGAERWRKTPTIDGAPAVLPEPPRFILGVTYDRDRLWPKMGPDGKAAYPDGPSHDTVAYNGQFTNSCLTVLADAGHVWMHNHRGVVACFRHDGSQVWARQVPAQVLRIASGQECRARTVPPVPPAMAGAILVVGAGDGLIAFDRETGAEKWRRTGLDFLGRFATMKLGDGPRGELVLLCSGEVLDAATGETLVVRCAPEMSDSACLPVVDGRVAYFHAGSAAVRFWLDAAGGLCTRVLWDSPADVRKRGSDINSALHSGSFAPTPVLYRGLLINHMAEMMSIEHGPQNSMRLHVSDAATGCALSQRYCVMPNGMHPASSTVIAGDFVYCGERGGKTFGNYSQFPETPRIAVLRAGEEAGRVTTNPGLATLAPPVADGRRLYLAGADEAVCIERPEALGDAFSEYELEALEKGFFAQEIGVKPVTAEAVVIAPLAVPPAGASVPVVPFLVGELGIPWDKSKSPSYVGFPWAMVGAWPLPDAAPADPYAAIEGLTGRIVAEGCVVKVGEQTAAFRPVPPEALVPGKKILERTMLNYIQGADTFALSPAVLFGEARPARGLFAALLDNRRSWTLMCEMPKDVRVWLAGREIKPNEHLRLEPGYYPFLLECRVTAETGNEPIGIEFREYPLLADWPTVRYNPTTEMARWRERVKRNEGLLRAVAASGPKGAYAKEALIAIGEESK